MKHDQHERPVHFVGSIPLANARDVFEQVGARVGTAVRAVPDGETGERLGWIRWHRDRLMRIDGFELYSEHESNGPQPHVIRQLRVGEGVRISDLQLRPLGYLEEARKSYEDFKLVRAQGKLSAHTRMQVCIPTPLALTTGVSGPLPELLDAFQQAAIEEVHDLCETIPAVDLCVQWDVCVETVAEEGRRYPQAAKPNARSLLDRWTFETAMASCAAVCEAVPAHVPVGVHLCYGDPDGSHVIEPHDASVLRDIANELTARVRRRLDWIHMPVPIEREDAAFFEPLRQLRLPPACQLYFGLVHQEDGVEGARRRIEVAKTVIGGTFGIATECGLGRIQPGIVPELLELHKAVAQLR
jgi:hypothetical protein